MKSYNRKITLFSTLILSCISILGLSQTSTATPFHDTKGNIEVTKAGQLQYTLAVDVPPGVKDISPNISLVYVSGAGNGLAGYNWNITGIAAISRVGRSLEKDGTTRGVQLDYTDYYSFGGQRLILKSGEYGKDGAEYVTEKYSNIRIKSIGSVTGQLWKGPEYWEVAFIHVYQDMIINKFNQ